MAINLLALAAARAQQQVPPTAPAEAGNEIRNGEAIPMPAAETTGYDADAAGFAIGAVVIVVLALAALYLWLKRARSRRGPRA